MSQNNVLGMLYLPNMYSKVSNNVISADVNVILRYPKSLMHVHKVPITNLDALHVGKRHWKIKTGHRDFRFLGSVVILNVVGAILL